MRLRSRSLVQREAPPREGNLRHILKVIDDHSHCVSSLPVLFCLSQSPPCLEALIELVENWHDPAIRRKVARSPKFFDANRSYLDAASTGKVGFLEDWQNLHQISFLHFAIFASEEVFAITLKHLKNPRTSFFEKWSFGFKRCSWGLPPPPMRQVIDSLNLAPSWQRTAWDLASKFPSRQKAIAIVLLAEEEKDLVAAGEAIVIEEETLPSVVVSVIRQQTTVLLYRSRSS